MLKTTDEIYPDGAASVQACYPEENYSDDDAANIITAGRRYDTACLSGPGSEELSRAHTDLAGAFARKPAIWGTY